VVEVSTIFTYYATYANEIKPVYIRVELSTISLIIYATCADEVDSTRQMRVELRVQYSCVTLPWNRNFKIQLVGTLQLCTMKGNIQVIVIIVEWQLIL